MLGSDILDIVIGMIFVFLMLSLVCSALNEFIEALVKHRAKDLERGIGELIGDPANTSKFIDQLYNHGLINSLFKGSYPPASTTDLPSYIPAQSFALAVMDLVKNPPPAGLTLPPNLTTALMTFQASAAGDDAKFQASLETWFNAGMDRVSGWYKRRSQWIILALGLIVAIVVNADSVNIARTLSNDASLRKAVVAMAQAKATAPPSATAGTSSDIEIQQYVNHLSGLGLPIGWRQPVPPKDATWRWWLYKLWGKLLSNGLGWLLTAVAISLGAPFWFDLLNKFVAVRSSSKPDSNPA